MAKQTFARERTASSPNAASAPPWVSTNAPTSGAAAWAISPGRARRPTKRGVAGGAEQGERNGAPGDGVDAVAGAVEDQGQRHHGKPRRQYRDTGGHEDHGYRQGPQRVVASLAGHLEDPGADLGRTDQGPVGHGRSEGDPARLEQRDQVDGHEGHHRPTEHEDAGHEQEGPPLPRIQQRDGSRRSRPVPSVGGDGWDQGDHQGQRYREV